ncbi:hypothetical protein [Pseudolactococcus reticulitermitis]|uniref:Enolase n=1 Tax=Pseudolactococcus reticulitermitis TaxID=2025039 RepID=A0A224WXC4_9LACT|nr:hypothetical protein [Lactococcus reticulitermitis]GAX46887.1 enolase [Lactococcus reticulitermitis]
MIIEQCECRYVLDSKGFQTVEVTIILSDGTKAMGSAPRGSTTGHFDIQYHEKFQKGENFTPELIGCKEKFIEIVQPLLVGTTINKKNIQKFELEMLEKGELNEYGNVLVATSYALWKLWALYNKVPLYSVMGDEQLHKNNVKHLVNIFDGYPSSSLTGIEFLLVSEENISLETLTEISNIKQNLKQRMKNQGYTVTVSNQGAVTVETDNFYFVIKNIWKSVKEESENAEKYSLGLDLAMTDHYDKTTGLYYIPWDPQKEGSYDFLESTYKNWEKEINLTYIEDAFSDNDYNSWKRFRESKPERLMVFGDDFFATNIDRLIKYGKYVDGIVVKPNQVGSISSALLVVKFAEENGIRIAFSQRTSETSDLVIAHLAMASDGSFLKAGGLDRLDRIEKYNEVLRSE